MAKGQQRSNREAKKPKKDKVKTGRRGADPQGCDVAAGDRAGEEEVG